MLELARESDWEDIKRLSVQIHDLHAAWRPDIYFHSEEPYPKEAFLEDIRQRLVYVAKLESTVAGYVVLRILEKGGNGIVASRHLQIDSICVDEALRGHGIGKAMVADVRALARVFRCDCLSLKVHTENDEAVGFYQKCGFRIRTIGMDMNL